MFMPQEQLSFDVDEILAAAAREMAVEFANESTRLEPPDWGRVITDDLREFGFVAMVEGRPCFPNDATPREIFDAAATVLRNWYARNTQYRPMTSEERDTYRLPWG